MSDVEAMGDKARDILESATFASALDRARRRLQDEWASEQDAGQRDALWHKLQAIDVVPRELRAIRDVGVKHRKDRERTQ